MKAQASGNRTLSLHGIAPTTLPAVVRLQHMTRIPCAKSVREGCQMTVSEQCSEKRLRWWQAQV